MDLGKVLIVVYGVVIFVFGFFAGYFVFESGISGAVVESGLPSDYLSSNDINIYDDRVVINVNNAMLSSYNSSGSMVPTLGSGANGISVRPESEEDIDVGDIITFRRGEELIVHRVVEKGLDSEGVYFITRGDGNGFVDSGVVRWRDVERRLIGVIY